MENDEDPLLAEIKQRLRASAAELLKSLATDAPGERIYAFFFNDASAAAATEEALARTAVEYRESGYEAQSGDTEALLRAMLRWDCLSAFAYDSLSPEEAAVPEPKEGENKWVARGLGTMAFLQKLRGSAENAAELLAWSGAEVLKEMDAAGTFGDGADRERIVLSVSHTGGSLEDFVTAAEPLNPPVVIERLKLEIAAGVEANKEFESPWKDQ